MLALVLGLLLATVIVVRPRRGGTPGKLRAQVTSWWLLLPPVFAAWALYPFGVPALVLLISVLAAKELTGLANRQPYGGL
jgi:predicted CDP-diglyceride synthetase/phosphatidate cytidylyltransferase